MSNEFFSPEGDLEKYFITEHWLIDQYVGDTLLSWGDNSLYQLGVNDNNTGRTSPVETFGKGIDWKQVSCGGYHTLALKSDGTLWSWGNNSLGQLGINDTSERAYPTLIENNDKWRSFSSGLVHSVAIKFNGTLWSWGGNNYSQLGLGDTIDKAIPTIVGSDVDWKLISANGFHSVAIKANGTMWSWGRNDGGQLGLGDTNNRSSPTQIGSDTDWKFVSSNRLHNLAIKQDGSLWTWGTNKDPDNPSIDGLLGLGSGIDNKILTPTKIGSDYNWKYVSCGAYHSAAIKINGSLWMWGRNDLGQLGVNDTNTRNIPTEIYGQNLFQWKTVSCGGFHTAGLKLDGSIYVWGDNSKLQSGRFSNVPNQTIIVPTTINNFKNNWKQVSSGFYHSSAVTSGSNPLLYIS